MRDVLYEQMLQNPSVTWFMNSSLNYVIFYEQPCTWLMNSSWTQNVISCILWKSGTPYQTLRDLWTVHWTTLFLWTALYVINEQSLDSERHFLHFVEKWYTLSTSDDVTHVEPTNRADG